MPLSSFRIVLFPEPFGPMMPMLSPRRRLKLTSCKAQNSCAFKEDKPLPENSLRVTAGIRSLSES